MSLKYEPASEPLHVGLGCGAQTTLSDAQHLFASLESPAFGCMVQGIGFRVVCTRSASDEERSPGSA